MMFINIEKQQKVKSSVMFINRSPTTHQKMSNLRKCLESNQCIYCKSCNHKNRHRRQDLPQTCRGGGLYVRIGYGPLNICNQTQGHVSGSINSDIINMIHTSQKSTKEGLNKDLEEDFSKSK